MGVGVLKCIFLGIGLMRNETNFREASVLRGSKLHIFFRVYLLFCVYIVDDISYEVDEIVESNEQNILLTVFLVSFTLGK
jgi:hypothetical protein